MLWQEARHAMSWECLFVAPFWLQCVVGHLGAKGEALILKVTLEGRVVGLIPLSLKDKAAYLLGIPDVCDYQDMVMASGHEGPVLQHLLDYLAGQGIERMDLQTLRPDARVCLALEQYEEESQWKATRLDEDVSFEMALPEDWEGYLLQLNSKQRHEVRRKIRRLESHGAYAFRMAGYQDDLQEASMQFLRLFHLNRTDKAAFMDETMSAYFRELIQSLAERRMLRLYFLDVDQQPVATVLCFDFNGTRYLYNSGYDAEYHDLSVGILSKVFSIREAIEEGCRAYDLLKGAEAYKKRIGGKEVPLYRYVVTL